ncbi:MAG: lysine--tRNA ligase, partial [Candidatus Bathyarchaeota archaeon]|nr:lysine--tRNA ligase [Candidatus Bathyarchaeota archaeon]
VKGGAYDTGEQIASKIFGWKGPYRIPYEWILLGEKAMKTHKGIAFTFSEWISVAPPEVYRYLILKEDPKKHINFQPENIQQIIDEFEKIERIYFSVEKASNPTEEKMAKHVYPISILGLPKKLPVRLPYRFATIIVQLKPLLGEEKILDKSLSVVKKFYGEVNTHEAVKAIVERLKMAEYWVKNYAPEWLKINITESVALDVKKSLSEKQKEALKIFLEKFTSKEWDEETLQFEVFEIGKKLSIGAKIFETFYLIFLGKKFGPRLAPFLLSLDKNFVIKRVVEALN